MTRQLRILQFITPVGFYGAERWVLALANSINSERVVCDLAVTRESAEQDLTLAELYPVGADQEVHYVEMKGRFDLSALKQLCRVIRERRIDVVHTHGYKSDILGFLAARRMGIACVSTPHGFSGKAGLKMAAFMRLGTFMLRYFDQVVPLSEELMSDMRRFGVPEEKTRLIRNGVDLTEIDTSLRKMLPRVDDYAGTSRTVGFIGQMIPRKGVGDLLEVFDRLHGSNPLLQLQLVGDGRQRQELEDKSRSLSSAEDIHFLGFRSDRLELLSRFDLFVMTSSLEGIPRCVMEAMAVGVPVVAYDIPGVDQLVEHGRTGLLAPHGDKEALAACCRKLLDDPDLGAELAGHARKMIEDKYSAARMAQEYEDLFHELARPSSVGSSRREVV